MITGSSLTFCKFSNLATVARPGILLTEDWEGTEGAVRDASFHGLGGM